MCRARAGFASHVTHTGGNFSYLLRSIHMRFRPLILGNQRTRSCSRQIRPYPLPHNGNAAAETDEKKNVNQRPEKPCDHTRKSLITEFRHRSMMSDGRHRSPVFVLERQTFLAAKIVQDIDRKSTRLNSSHLVIS